MWWLKFGLCLLAVNGYWALIVAIVNRLHGFALPEWVIHLTHKIHDVLLLAAPVCLVLLPLVGWGGPPVLQGGSWLPMSVPWWIVLSVGWTAAAVFWLAILERKLRPWPAALKRVSSERHNIAAELGKPPLGRGPYAWMETLPGNEICRLELTTLDISLARIPAAWDGLTIVQLTDAHFIGSLTREYYEKVCEHVEQLQPDLIVFTGDLLDRMEYLHWLDTTWGRLQAPLGRFFILGNHDWYLDQAGIRKYWTDLGWVDVSTTPAELEHRGHKLWIGGTEWPWMGHLPDLSGVSAETFRLLLSHTPDNIRWAQRQRIDLMLSGHNHGGQIRLPVIGPIYTPSRYGCYFASGTFNQPPTLLHVCRGLAGRHPLRYGCLPEVSRLRLKHAPLSD